MPTEEVYAQFLNGTDEKYNLEDSTFLISTNMDRFALSKMLNELLNLENPVSFDFLMNEDRLRGTVSEKMEEFKIESESTIQLVYVLAINDPNQKNVDNLNDWISGLSYDNNSVIDLFTVCSYNGRVAVYKSNSLNKVFEFSNDKSKSSVHLCTNESLGYTCELVCGHFNGLVEVYNVNTNVDNPLNNLVARNDRYTDTVTSVTTDHSGRVILSGGYDKVVTLYENVDLNLDSDSGLEDNKSKKRTIDQKVLSQLGKLEYHTKPITKLKHSYVNNSLFVSSSMDGFLCTWDLEKKKLVSYHNTGKPVTCLAVSPLGSEVCTGSNDGTLVVWDLRSSDSSVSLNQSTVNELKLTKKSLSRPFSRLVSDISWNPSVNMVSAIGMDGNVVLVDVRSPKFPLQLTHCEYQGESDRGTCTTWTSHNDVVYTTASGLVNKLNYKEITP